MYRLRAWSVRHARGLRSLYDVIERGLAALHPLLCRIGYERLDRPVLAVERAVKGLLLDSQSCGQCIAGFTGMACPMNCPKALRNGPCGGVRPDGSCELDPDMTCVWVLAWQGNVNLGPGLAESPMQQLQPALDHRLWNRSAWLRAARERASAIPLRLESSA